MDKVFDRVKADSISKLNNFTHNNIKHFIENHLNTCTADDLCSIKVSKMNITNIMNLYPDINWYEIVTLTRDQIDSLKKTYSSYNLHFIQHIESPYMELLSADSDSDDDSDGKRYGDPVFFTVPTDSWDRGEVPLSMREETNQYPSYRYYDITLEDRIYVGNNGIIVEKQLHHR